MDLLQPIHREGVVVVARVPVQGVPAIPARRNLHIFVWSFVAVTLETFQYPTCLKPPVSLLVPRPPVALPVLSL